MIPLSGFEKINVTNLNILFICQYHGNDFELFEFRYSFCSIVALVNDITNLNLFII